MMWDSLAVIELAQPFVPVRSKTKRVEYLLDGDIVRELAESVQRSFFVSHGMNLTVRDTPHPPQSSAP